MRKLIRIVNNSRYRMESNMNREFVTKIRIFTSDGFYSPFKNSTLLKFKNSFKNQSYSNRIFIDFMSRDKYLN
jgi:hypothetical protein